MPPKPTPAQKEAGTAPSKPSAAATATKPSAAATATKPDAAASKPILHRPEESKTKKKGVEFDPQLKAHDLEDSNKKGHSKLDDHKIQQEIDLAGDHGKRTFARNLLNSLHPLSTLLQIFGRFPLSRQRSKDHRTHEYTANCASLGLFQFNLITILLFYALIIGLYTIIKINANVAALRKSNYKSSEDERIYKTQLIYDKALVQRNAIPLIIVFTTLVQACMSSILITKKREYLAHIFTFINKASYTLHMDLAEKTKDFSIQSTVIFIIITCIFIMFSCLKFGSSAVGTPAIFGSLMIRTFLGIKNYRIWLDPDDPVMLLISKIVGGIFLIVIYAASIAPILLYIYKCKIVRNAFAFWNGRAYCALLRGMEHAQTEEARTTYNMLFKDHCILLDLIESLDQMYSFTLESFFCLQAISLIFQMYFFFRVGSQSKLSDTVQLGGRSVVYLRPHDWLPPLVILFATSVILLCAGKASVKLSEEAEAGMEVIRRKGVIGRRTDQELEFLHSMSFSFQSYKRLEISGAGYLYYNKLFIVYFIAVCVFCFLLLIQFRPFLELMPNYNRGSTNAIGRFLRRIEGTSEHKSRYINSSSDLEWALALGF